MIWLFKLFWAKCFNCDACPHKQFYCDTCPACACQSDLQQTSTGKSTWRLAEGCFGQTLLASTGGLPGYWPGPAYLPIWWWPSKSVTVMVQRQVSTARQPPFKSLDVPPLGLNVLPHPRLQGQPRGGRPVSSSQPISESAVVEARPWRRRGGRLVLRWTYITNLQVWNVEVILVVLKLLAQWLRRQDAMYSILGLILHLGNFLLFWNVQRHINFYICTWYIHCINKF
jgi:hypothetical protein